MKSAFILLAAAIGLYIAFEVIRIVPLVRASNRLVADAIPFSRSGAGSSTLILGDSTGVGIGASRSEDSVAGRIAAALPTHALENRAVSGARVADIGGQFHVAQRRRYALIVIQVGGNDIIRFRSAASAAGAIEPFLKEAKARADKVVFLSAGNVGGAYLFPWVLRSLYQRLTLAYHAEFAAAAVRTGVTYINLYTPPDQDPFIQQPQIFLAADGLHPSSEGYRLWFEKLAAFVKVATP